MRKGAIAATALMLAGSSGAGAVEICHVANAGFLIKGEDTAVLIDGLMEEDVYDGQFALPSAETLKNMFERTGDFENLSLVLATHRHGDHFDPKATVRHLRATEGVRYVVPADTIPALEAQGLTDSDRGRLILIEDATRTDRTHDAVRIETFDIDHGPDMPQNVGYRVTVDGVSFFHTGDINSERPQLEAAGLTALEVDALIIPFWYPIMSEERLAAVKASWSPGMLVATHFNPTPPAWMAQFGGLEGVQETIRDAFGEVLFLTEEGGCRTVE